MGIRLIILQGGAGARISTTGAALVLPLGTAVVEIAAGGTRERIDRSSWFLVPPGVLAAVTAKSPTAQTVVLGPSRSLVERVAGLYAGEIDPARYDRYVRTTELLARTTWVNEIAHRYLFERAVCKKRENDATRFLEAEVVKELYFLCHERHTALARPTMVSGRSAVVQRTLRHIEEHLFQPDVLRDLAKVGAISASTLLRAFKREVGESPLSYLRIRRLDEALLLLKSRRFRVGEVSSLVGYGNLAAFSQAFRARFGMRPSDVIADATRP